MSIIRPTEQYSAELAKAIDGCASLLDVGCGANSPIRLFKEGLTMTVGLDAHEPSVRESCSASIHTHYVLCRATDIGSCFLLKSFDCVLLSDLVEDLPKRDGERLITIAESLARKRVVIFTPNGYVPQNGAEGNPLQKHLSGWTAEGDAGEGL